MSLILHFDWLFCIYWLLAKHKRSCLPSERLAVLQLTLGNVWKDHKIHLNEPYRFQQNSFDLEENIWAPLWWKMRAGMKHDLKLSQETCGRRWKKRKKMLKTGEVWRTNVTWLPDKSTERRWEKKVFFFAEGGNKQATAYSRVRNWPNKPKAEQ